MGMIEVFPILGTPKQFSYMNESTVCTVETKDTAGAVRGGIALGLSRHGLPHGFAIYQTIEEAEGMVALLLSGIEDAKRIEAGQEPLAPIAGTEAVKH